MDRSATKLVKFIFFCGEKGVYARNVKRQRDTATPISYKCWDWCLQTKGFDKAVAYHTTVTRGCTSLLIVFSQWNMYHVQRCVSLSQCHLCVFVHNTPPWPTTWTSSIPPETKGSCVTIKKLLVRWGRWEYCGWPQNSRVRISTLCPLQMFWFSCVQVSCRQFWRYVNRKKMILIWLNWNWVHVFRPSATKSSSGRPYGVMHVSSSTHPDTGPPTLRLPNPETRPQDPGPPYPDPRRSAFTLTKRACSFSNRRLHLIQHLRWGGGQMKSLAGNYKGLQ